MAIYHFSGSIISRSQGRSAVACSAYRSGERMYDARQEKTHDYTKKQDVAHTEILLPEHAPLWMSSREKLWNSVEASEKRKDAQLAREFNFALPKELTLEQNIALAREFVQQEFVSKGMVADLAIHNDKSSSGEPQPHAHVMLTLREVTAEGFGQKVREWNAKDNIYHWRESWAESANKHLFLQGHDLKIDHRTLKAQSIDLEPQHKIGATVAQGRSARLEDHQRIARENGEKLLRDPNIALTAITRQQSTFTHQDVARFVNRHTVDSEQFQAVYDRVMGCQELVSLGQDSKQRERFTTQEMLEIETKMLERAKQLTERHGHSISENSKTQATTHRTLSEEQKTAFLHLVSEGDLKNVVGYAGTGKSYLLGAAKEAWEAQGYCVYGGALSGIAAENLEAGSGIESRTLASRQYYWDKGEQRLTSKDILVVDEAGMIGSRQLARVLMEAEQAKAKVVLVGDPYQLQAIEAGAAFRAIAETTPTVSLTEIRRQQVPWQREATVELATGKTADAIQRYNAHDHVHCHETQAHAKQELIALWNDARLNEPDKTQIILTYTRDEVKSLNEMARALRKEQGELGEDHTLMTVRGERAFAAQDRIYFLQNDRELDVKNGSLGTIERIQGNMLVVRLDKPSSSEKTRTITFSTDHYDHLDHGYAATIHKSQGVTVDRSYILASKYMDGHATYVGLSRHEKSADIFYSREEFPQERALVNTLSRERAKDVTLDYSPSKNFANQRGIDQPISSEIKINGDRLEKSDLKKPLFLDKNDDMVSPQALKNYNHAEQSLPLRKDHDFSHFKKQFESQHPEQAQLLKEALRPPHERSALRAEKHIYLLEKASQESRMPRSAQQELEKYATSIAKDPQIMTYLREHKQELSEKIQQLSQSYSKRIEYDRGMDR